VLCSIAATTRPILQKSPEENKAATTKVEQVLPTILQPLSSPPAATSKVKHDLENGEDLPTILQKPLSSPPAWRRQFKESKAAKTKVKHNQKKKVMVLRQKLKDGEMF
jgi:hypothetical protein